jgi:CheY-like chemotaxis protein
MSSALQKPVLVVDGDRHMRTLIASIVKNSGIAEVAPAASLEDARRELRIATPAAIITEYRLPDSDGLSLIAWLRRAPDSPAPQVPALVLTGHSLADVVMRARNAGATPRSPSRSRRALCSTSSISPSTTRARSCAAPASSAPAAACASSMR